MPLPTIAGTVRCSFRGLTPSGQPWVNVVHCRYSGGASNPGTTEIAALDVSLVKAWMGPAVGGGDYFLKHCRNTVTLIDATYYPLDGSSLAVVVPHAAVGFNASAQTSPSEVSMVMTIRTASRGRRNRGRIYLPPATVDNFVASGNYNQTFAGNLCTQITAVQAELTPKQWKIGVASYGKSILKNGTHSTWTPYFTEATSFTMDATPDVQRRRK